jgi:F0F1-type ATP synthase membrane subunit b/b'
MGNRPTPSEEVQQIRQATREAHEAMQGLADLIRQARELAANLTTAYQAYHDRELKELANALAAEHNQISTDLNASVERARIMISTQIMAGVAVFDQNTSTVSIRFGQGRFDDQQPLPYPEVTTKETDQ